MAEKTLRDYKQEYYLKRNAELTKNLLKIKKMIEALNLEADWNGENKNIQSQ